MNDKVKQAVDMGLAGVAPSQAYAAMGGDADAAFVVDFIEHPEHREEWLLQWLLDKTTYHHLQELLWKMRNQYPTIKHRLDKHSAHSLLYVACMTWETLLRRAGRWPEKN